MVETARRPTNGSERVVPGCVSGGRAREKRARSSARRRARSGLTGNNLDKARRIFERAIKHRARIRLTIWQRTRVLDQWPRRVGRTRPGTSTLIRNVNARSRWMRSASAWSAVAGQCVHCRVSDACRRAPGASRALGVPAKAQIQMSADRSHARKELRHWANANTAIKRSGI